MLEQTRAIEARNRGPCSTVYVVRAFLTMDFVLSLCEILSSVEGGPERARPGGATLPCASICSIRATLRRTVPAVARAGLGETMQRLHRLWPSPALQCRRLTCRNEGTHLMSIMPR